MGMSTAAPTQTTLVSTSTAWTAFPLQAPRAPPACSPAHLWPRTTTRGRRSASSSTRTRKRLASTSSTSRTRMVSSIPNSTQHLPDWLQQYHEGKEERWLSYYMADSKTDFCHLPQRTTFRTPPTRARAPPRPSSTSAATCTCTTQTRTTACAASSKKTASGSRRTRSSRPRRSASRARSRPSAPEGLITSCTSRTATRRLARLRTLLIPRTREGICSVLRQLV